MHNLTVTKAIFSDTGAYLPQFRRPMDTSSIDGHTIAQLQKSTNNGTSITPANLSQIASRIVAPSVNTQGVATIDGGWDARRFRFLIEITLTMGLSTARLRKIITGYSDHYGLGMRNDPRYGYFDPNMQLIINSVVTLRDVDVPTPQGVVTQTTVADVDQILIGSHMPGLTGQRDYTLRVEDVYRHVQLPSILNQADMGLVINATSGFQDGVVKSRRSNNVPTSYLSQMLKANKEAHDTSDVAYDDMSQIYSRAMGIAQENTIEGDVVLNWFNDLGDFSTKGALYWSEFITRCPNILPEVKVIQAQSPQQLNQLAMNVDSQHWQGTNTETKIATEISIAVPGLMMETSISTCAFIFSNLVGVGQPPTFTWVQPAPESLITGVDWTANLEKLRIRIMTEIIPSITSGGLIPLELHVYCGVFHQTNITIKIGGVGEGVRYVSPTYCDQLISPMITSSALHLDNASKQFTNIYNHLTNSSMVANTQPTTMNFSGTLPPITSGYSHASAPATNLQSAPQSLGDSRWN